MFELGDNVTCVNDDFGGDERRIDMIIKSFSQLPKKGEEYTVRGFRPTKHGVGILLEEIHNEPIVFKDTTAEPGFALRRFKKSAKISIEIKEVEHETN